MKATLTVERKIFLFLLAWSVAVLTLMSTDSPLHGPWDRCDSSWFFTSGKALMNGMRPYVDFSDSKGPLLWLFYGIGYLLSPRTYHGVWGVSCLLYAGILYYNYKTARLFLGDGRRSLAVAMVMPFFYFQYWYHDDVRAEDFCTLPVAVTLYHMLRLLTSKRERNPRGEQAGTAARLGLTMGACFMALVLIKWNIALMQGTMLAVILWYYMRQDYRKVKPFMGWMAAGMAMTALPFAVYLAARGCLDAFFNEYFVNTLLTVTPEEGDQETSFMKELAWRLGTPEDLALLLALLLSGWLVSHRLPRLRYAPLMAASVFFAACSHHTLEHYYNICSVFLIFLPVHALSLKTPPLKPRFMAVLAACIIGWGILENTREDTHLYRVSVWATDTEEENFNCFSDLIQGERPRVMFLYGCDYGYGLKSGALPAGKYWSYQKGTTPEMEAEHLRLLQEGLADYVIVNNKSYCYGRGFGPRQIRSYGYEKLCDKMYVDFMGQYATACIYRRKDLK